MGHQCVAEYSLAVKLAECLNRLEDHRLVMPECEVAVCFAKELLQNITLFYLLLYSYVYVSGCKC